MSGLFFLKRIINEGLVPGYDVIISLYPLKIGCKQHSIMRDSGYKCHIWLRTVLMGRIKIQSEVPPMETAEIDKLWSAMD